MALQVRVLVDLAEDQSDVPNHPPGGSQASLSLVPRDAMFSSELQGHKVCTWCTDICVSKTLIHIK